jgi:exodeoxyribonuclease III
VIIATWNVNSVLARLPLVLRWLKAARPDVLCLQETKCTDERFPAAEFAEAGYRAAVHGQPTYNGVAVLARGEITDVRKGLPGDEAGSQARVIAATVGGIRLLNVYVPNGQAVGTEKYAFKLNWLNRLREYLDEEFWADDEVLICGDFNVAPEDRDVHDPVAWRGKILCSGPERAHIEHVRQWGFMDAFRLHVAAGGHYSWWDYRAGSFRMNAGLRIDHIWVSEPLAERCTRAWIDRDPRGWERPSDHTPVLVEFA